MTEHKIGDVIWFKTKANDGSIGWEHKEIDTVPYWEKVFEKDLERLEANGKEWPHKNSN